MADDLFNKLADQHQAAPATGIPTAQAAPASGGSDALFNQLADEHQGGGDPKNPSSYGEIFHKPTGVADAIGQVGDAGRLAAGRVMDGAGDFLSDIPGMVKGAVHGAMPGQFLQMPGGQATEDTIRGGIKAIDLARKGKYTQAAKATPMIGGMYDYATSHPIEQTLGYVGTGALLTKGVEGAVGKVAGMGGKTPPTVAGETPPVKAVIEVLKPTNAVKAIPDYNLVLPRLIREHPALQSGKATLPEIQEALDQSMHENRNYAEAHIGPAKDARMQVDLSPVADAITKNISSTLERNAPAQADALRKIADRYRGKTDIADVENMMHELNAKVADMRRMNPGQWAQTTAASDSKAFLDATTKAMRKQYNAALEKFNGSPAVASLNREYGAMMGFRQDLAGLTQSELTRSTPSTPGLMSKVSSAGSALKHPLRTAVASGMEAMDDTAAGNIPKLAQALKDYKGPPALDLPTPPIHLGPGGGAGSPGNIPPGTYPGARPVPAGAYPGANPGPTAGYTPSPAGPLPQRKLLGGATPGQKAPLITPPPADTSGPVPNAGPRPGMGMGQQVGERTLPPPDQEIRPQPGEHYGGNGMAPVNQADVVHPSVKQHNVGMVAIGNPEGGRVWVPEGTQGNWIWSKNAAGRYELIDKHSLVQGKLSPASELPKRKKSQ